jgi:hypothetical protein
MTIKWGNIFGLLLLIFSIYLFVKLAPCLDRIFENISDGYYGYSESPTIKIAILGLICITIVSVVKIICNR